VVNILCCDQHLVLDTLGYTLKSKFSLKHIRLFHLLYTNKLIYVHLIKLHVHISHSSVKSSCLDVFGISWYVFPHMENAYII